MLHLGIINPLDTDETFDTGRQGDLSSKVRSTPWSRLIVWFAVLPFKLQLTPSPLVGGVRDSMESDCAGEGF